MTVKYNLTATTVFTVVEDDGRRWEFRYNDSLTVNVWSCDDDGTPIAEVDVITLSEPSRDDARLAVEDWLALVSED